MNRTMLKSVIPAVLFLLAVQFGFAQKNFELQPEPKLVISGTSSLHDWDMPSNQAKGEMKAVAESGKLTKIESLKIVMPAESIKSGKSGMDKKAYEALKTNKYKEVIYTLSSATKSGDTWTFEGIFNIAGKSKNVSLKVKESTQSGAHVLSGHYDFKLSDYNITPPKALMGTIKTGNDVAIDFTVAFK